jgi:hypothetical protein
MESEKDNVQPTFDDEYQSQQMPDNEYDEVDTFQATQQLLTDESEEEEEETDNLEKPNQNLTCKSPNSDEVNKTIKQALKSHSIRTKQLIDYAKWTKRTWDDVNISNIHRCIFKHSITEGQFIQYIRENYSNIDV